MFATGNYAKIWESENKGNYHICKITTSRKDKETGGYKTDFSAKVRFLSDAHQKNPQVGQRIKIGSCGVTNAYDKEEGKLYTNYLIFDFESDIAPTTTLTPIEESDLPF